MSSRNDAIVAARVPEEIKEQGNALLAKLGFTPTQLINAAYQYVLTYKQLPFESPKPKPGKRTLDQKRMQEIVKELESLQVSTFDYTLGGTRTFKEAVEEERRAEYEAQQ